jgi:hypothetical protein
VGLIENRSLRDFHAVQIGIKQHVAVWHRFA